MKKASIFVSLLLPSLLNLAYAQGSVEDLQRQAQVNTQQGGFAGSAYAERLKQVQSTNKQEPVVYDSAPYQDLFAKLQLDRQQTVAWERVIRAHQSKNLAMQGLFETFSAVGTVSRNRDELVALRAMLTQLGPEQSSPQGKALTKALRATEGVEGALRSFYAMLTPYQQRDYEIHQEEMLLREATSRRRR